MKKTTRRVYMSILLVVLSLFTAVATTFAWVGISSNTTFQKFSINLKANDDEEQSEYGIQLSLTGEKNDFHDELMAEDIYTRILLNMGYSETQINKYGSASRLFQAIHLEQCTVARNSLETPATATRLTSFYNMSGLNLVTEKNSYGDFVKGHGFIFFDLYLTVYNISNEVTTSAPTIFLKKDLLTADNCETQIMNNIDLHNYFSNDIYGKVKINAANACRVAVQRFNIVEKGALNYYASGYNMHPNRLSIYQTGSLTPTYDYADNLYDFGGIMPKEDNLAYKYYTSIYGDNFDSLEGALPFSRVLNRGDIVYENGDTLDSSNMLLPYKPTVEGGKDGGLTSKDMVKFRFYFWFEGWDGDCIDAINNVPVSMNLVFSTKTNAE